MPTKSSESEQHSLAFGLKLKGLLNAGFLTKQPEVIWNFRCMYAEYVCITGLHIGPVTETGKVEFAENWVLSLTFSE